MSQVLGAHTVISPEPELLNGLQPVPHPLLDTENPPYPSGTT